MRGGGVGGRSASGWRARAHLEEPASPTLVLQGSQGLQLDPHAALHLVRPSLLLRQRLIRRGGRGEHVAQPTSATASGVRMWITSSGGLCQNTAPMNAYEVCNTTSTGPLMRVSPPPLKHTHTHHELSISAPDPRGRTSSLLRPLLGDRLRLLLTRRPVCE